MDYPSSNIELYERLRTRGWNDLAIARAQAGYHLAARHLSAKYRPDGRPFISHLVRTAGILLEDGAREPVVLAGLVHSHYTHGDFRNGPEALSTLDRRTLAAALGQDAEALVSAYSAFVWSRRSMRETIEHLKRHRPVHSREVLWIRVANELEEALDRSFVYCTSAKRETSLAKLALTVEIAQLIGRGNLVRRMEAVLEDYECVGSERGWAAPPSMARNGCYELLPPSAGVRVAARDLD